jgi:hypothetical protein
LRELGAVIVEDLGEIYEDQEILSNLKTAITPVEFGKFLKAIKQTKLLSNKNILINQTSEEETSILDMEKKIFDAEKRITEATKTFESKTKLKELEMKLKKVEETAIAKTKRKHEINEKEDKITKRLESTKRRKKIIAGNILLIYF